MDCQELDNEVIRHPGFNVPKEPLHVFNIILLNMIFVLLPKIKKIPFHYIIKANNKNGPPSYLLTKVHLLIARLIPIWI